MVLKQLGRDFTVCKVARMEEADFSREYVFFSKTDDELSLVCETTHAPKTATHTEDGWKALKIDGVLDFGLVGIIAKIAGILAENSISVFVISTYNTDYILLKAIQYEEALRHLRAGGYTIS